MEPNRQDTYSCLEGKEMTEKGAAWKRRNKNTAKGLLAYK